MFNPLSPSQTTLAIGRVLKQAAATASDPSDDYQRAQLLSAYSMTRHLAAEQADGGKLLAWFRSEMTTLLEAAETDGKCLDLTHRRDEIAKSRDEAELGALVSELLSYLQRSGSDVAVELRVGVRRLLRDLCDREVKVLGETSL